MWKKRRGWWISIFFSCTLKVTPFLFCKNSLLPIFFENSHRTTSNVISQKYDPTIINEVGMLSGSLLFPFHGAWERERGKKKDFGNEVGNLAAARTEVTRWGAMGCLGCEGKYSSTYILLLEDSMQLVGICPIPRKLGYCFQVTRIVLANMWFFDVALRKHPVKTTKTVAWVAELTNCGPENYFQRKSLHIFQVSPSKSINGKTWFDCKISY